MHDTLAASDYSLVQEGTHEPRPNYWAAVPWRRGMGTSVLAAPTSPAPDLRLYAHCLRNRPGAVGLVAINLGDEARSVPMEGRARTWVMQAPQVDASAITMNGKSPRQEDDGSLSGLDPAAAEGSVTIRPRALCSLRPMPCAIRPAIDWPSHSEEGLAAASPLCSTEQTKRERMTMTMSVSAADRVGLDFICALGAEPVGFVEATAQLGCRHIGLALHPIVTVQGIDADWSLRDTGLRRAFRDALARNDVAVSIAEGFVAMPGSGFAPNWEDDLAVLAELGAPCANFVSVEPDRLRALDQCAEFAQAAARSGMRSSIEFVPGLPVIHDLSSALAAVAHVGRPDFGLLLDAMHIFRSGSTVADVAALDPARIGYVQICDVPAEPAMANYADEARFDRLPPGEGDLPLRELIGVLPADCILGLELPMRSAAKAGQGMVDRLAGAVESLRRLAG